MTRFSLVVLALVTASGPALPAPPPDLAKVNGEAVTAAELKEAFVRRHGGHQKFLAGEAEIRKMLDIVVDQRLLVQEAYRLDLQERPEIVERSGKYLDRKELEYLVRTEIDEKSKPSEEEIRSAWEKNTGESLQVRQIVVPTRAEAEDLRAQLVRSGDIDRLVRACSTAPSRIYGGRVPQAGWGTMDASWEDVVFRLSPGEVSTVIRGKDGWEIVQLEARTAVDRPDYAKARNRIEAVLRRRKLDERKKAFSEELWAKYHARRMPFDATPGGLATAARTTPDAPVATWDGGALSIKEFTGSLDGRMLAALPPDQVPEQLDHILTESVNEKLALLEARSRKIERVPEVAEAVRIYREDLMEGALYDGFILKDVKVSDEEVKAWFESHQKELAVPEKRRVAHIVTADCAEAEALKRRLDAGERFEELVKAHSKDAESAKSGGDLGFVGKKETPKEFEPVLALREGEVSEPIPSKFGCHLIRVTKIVPERPMEFDEARGDIAKQLLQEKQKERRAVWVKKLRAASTIKINDAGVKALAKEAAQP